jgi:alpha-beta hydrolase superfamily lysophospholipase
MKVQAGGHITDKDMFSVMWGHLCTEISGLTGGMDLNNVKPIEGAKKK